MKFASRSAIESLSSANCGSSASRAKAGAMPLLCDPRNDDLEEGRRGVVGRETGERDRARNGSRVCDAERVCSMFSGGSDIQMLYGVIGVVFLDVALLMKGQASVDVCVDTKVEETPEAFRRASRCSLAGVHRGHMTWNNLMDFRYVLPFPLFSPSGAPN
jgi:hypothetical protein